MRQTFDTYSRQTKGLLLLALGLFSSAVGRPVLAANAPVTFAPVITNPTVGPLALPLVVQGFTSIGAVSLALDYDPVVIAYQSNYTANPALAGSFMVGDNATAVGKRQIRVSWYGDPNGVSLTNGATLCTLNFTYLTNGAVTALNWYENPQGTACEYAGAAPDFEVLMDTPTADYYKNGRVGLAPVSVLHITNAAPGFANISWTPSTTGLVLQETLNLSPTNWNTAPSGTTNPVTVPTTGPARFYRLLQTGP